MAELSHSKANTKKMIDVAEEGLGTKPAVRERSKFHFPYAEEDLLAEIRRTKRTPEALAQPTDPEVGD